MWAGMVIRGMADSSNWSIPEVRARTIEYEAGVQKRSGYSFERYDSYDYMQLPAGFGIGQRMNFGKIVRNHTKNWLFSTMIE